MDIVNTFLGYCRRHRFQSHLFFWAGMLMLSVSTDFFGSESWSFTNSFIYAVALLITQIPSAYFLAYFVVPRLSSSRKYISTILLSLLAGYLLSVLARIIVVYTAEPLAMALNHCPDPVPPKDSLIEIATDFYKLFKVYIYHTLSVPFVFLAAKLFKDQYDMREKALRLEKEKITTELKLLKSQLNPHFLFNTLNNIYTLSLEGSPSTADAIFRLSGMLDHILYRSNHSLVPVSEEIQLIENYCSLERLRYTERLQFNQQLTVEQDIQIPPLILVSIVENAFKHGLSDHSGHPGINISLLATAEKLTFEVVNTIGISNNNTGKTRIGLQNIRQQLELTYPGQHSLDISRDENYFKVHLEIRLKHPGQ